MITYANFGGNSNIRGYEFGTDSIKIQFNDFSVYEYTAKSVGLENLGIMKTLAKQGSGLNSFIMKNVKHKYI